MKTVDVTKMKDSLSRCAHEAKEENETVVVIEDGKPIAALVPLEEDDLEDLLLSLNPEFQARMVRARESVAQGKSIPFEDAAQEIDGSLSKRPSKS